MTNQTFQLPATITETIYNHLKKAIIEGAYSPGERLQEKEIAAQFGVSTTPVREAFQRLSAEDYIAITARKDVSVISVSTEEIEELFELVRILDAFASRKAILRLSDGNIDELRRMTRRLDHFYRRRMISDYIKENLNIHKALWKHCGNKVMYQYLVEMGDKYALYGRRLFAPHGRAKESRALTSSHEEHLALMEAIEKRDPRLVEKILLSHWGKKVLEEEKKKGGKKKRGNLKKKIEGKL